MSFNTRPDGSESPPAALAASSALQEHIIAVIQAAHGSIRFEEFMRMTLYEPGLGYYSAGAEKLGVQGDFVTAPEISPLFGRCVARQVEQVLEALDGGEVLEFGAGSGRFAVDLLASLERCERLPSRYRIMEVSADLRERQRALISTQLPHLLERVGWLDALPEEPVFGVVLANEVLDAMPVARVRKSTGGRWNELHVGLANGLFEWREVALSADSTLASMLKTMEFEHGELPAGYTTEINTQLAPWFQSLAHVLTRGAAFFIDYGYPQREYYSAERTDGTLLCHHRHRVHADPFMNIGLQDISASVDFTAVAEAAQEAGFTVAGYTTQMQFLMALGIDRELNAMSAPDALLGLQFAQQLKQLVLPGGMGERFKVLALLRNLELPLTGFSIGNDLHRL